MSLCLLLSASVLASSPATVAIADLDAQVSLTGLGGQATRLLVEEARKAALPILTPEELRARLTPAQYEELRKCGPRPGCASPAARLAGVNRVVTGTLSRTETHYVVRLWLLDIPTLEVVAEVDRNILIASRRFVRDVEQAAVPLLKGQREPQGTLRLTSPVKNVDVTVEGEAVEGPLPRSLQLKPGTYEVRASKKKYLSVTRMVSVEAGQEVALELPLLLMPGEVPDEEVVPPLVRPQDGPSGGFSLGPGTVVAGLATVGALGTAVGFGVAASGQDAAIQRSLDAATGEYGATRQQAFEVQRTALVANVLYGVAGAGAVATAVFLVLDVVRAQPATPTVAVAPVPGGAAVLLQGGLP